MEEIRRDVVGYEWKYKVSNIWNVKSLERFIYTCYWWPRTIWGRLLKLTNNQDYMIVSFRKDWKSIAQWIHRLVAKAFIPNPHNKPQVNHKDWNTSNNNVDNLEWVTVSENALHSSRVLGNKPHKTSVIQWDRLWRILRIWGSISEASNELNIRQGSISNNCSGRTKSAGWYIWEYYNHLSQDR